MSAAFSLAGRASSAVIGWRPAGRRRTPRRQRAERAFFKSDAGRGGPAETCSSVWHFQYSISSSYRGNFGAAQYVIDSAVRQCVFEPATVDVRRSH